MLYLEGFLHTSTLSYWTVLKFSLNSSNSSLFWAHEFVLLISVYWCRFEAMWTISELSLLDYCCASLEQNPSFEHSAWSVISISSPSCLCKPLYTPKLLISLLGIQYPQSELMFKIWLLSSKNERVPNSVTKCMIKYWTVFVKMREESPWAWGLGESYTILKGWEHLIS